MIAIGALVFIAVVVFFLPKQQIQVPSGETAPAAGEAESALANATTSTQPTTAAAGWKDSELKDVRTGSKFKISDFAGKVVIIESFAVWCPKCKQQQDEIKKFEQENPEVISVSLDTDPNEDEARVLEHINRYGYGWRFAVSPTQVTQNLISEFGLTVVNAPSTPVILVCADQKTRLMKTGIKDPTELKDEIAKGC